MLPDRVPLSEYQACAEALDCSPDIIRALAMEETWANEENPNDLRLEAGKWKQFRFASKAAKRFDRARNSGSREDRWRRFHEMDEVCKADALLNPRARNAAILAHSFGWCQIMGFNHRRAGFEDPRNFLAAMRTLAGQRRAFITMARGDDHIHRALRTEDVQLLALHWNGPAYRRNKWDTDVARHMAALRIGGSSYA